MNGKREYIGTGWGFPPEFSKSKGGTRMADGVEDIRESLEILFTTARGERVMRPDYGADLSQYLFEPLDTTMRTYVRELVRDAILFHEPRIRLLDMKLETVDEEGRLQLELTFEIKGSNSRFNFVFPHYKEEGSDVRK
jgi:uncharacterized protein